MDFIIDLLRVFGIFIIYLENNVLLYRATHGTTHILTSFYKVVVYFIGDVHPIYFIECNIIDS